MQPTIPETSTAAEAGREMNPVPCLATVHPPLLAKVSALGGCAVLGADGARLGAVTDVVADLAPQRGAIVYVLVAPEHPFPDGAELLALPWHDLSYHAPSHSLRLLTPLSGELARPASDALRSSRTPGAGPRTLPRAPGGDTAYEQPAGQRPAATPAFAQPGDPVPTRDASDLDPLPELGLVSPFVRRSPRTE
jgi:hypothetical protein